MPQPETKAERPPVSPLEWAASAIGALLVCLMIGFTLFEALSFTSPDPELSVEVERVSENENGHLVRFKALNNGDTTAARVIVEAQLMRDGLPVETATVTLDYVPAHSGAGGGVLFENDPAGLDLQIRAVSYTDP